MRNIEDLLYKCDGSRDGIKYAVVIRAFMWLLWMHRNEVCFKGKVKTIALLASDVRALAFLWYKNRGKQVSDVQWDV